MRKHVRTTGGSYSRYVYSFDTEQNVFFVHAYHYGMVDDAEECDDGEKQVSAYEVLDTLIHDGALEDVSRFYEELKVPENIDAVLLHRRQGSWINKTGYLEDHRYQYFAFPDGGFVVYYEGSYFADGNPTADFSAVKRILQERFSVTCSRYSNVEKRWITEPLVKA